MKPVFQTRHGVPAGNCTEACLASVLEIPLQDVPDLGQLPDRSAWFDTLDGWLASRGLGLALVVCDPGKLPLYLPVGVPIIVGGPALANGVPHYVVGEMQVIDGARRLVHLHDPHEGWHGISAVEDILLVVRR